jgi:hypothetical protein
VPQLIWPTDPIKIVQESETRHQQPQAGALLAWAAWTVDGLRYLDDIDRAYETSRSAVGGHRPDVVDVAHARWATGTCMTALDLCAAALARGLCGHTKPREVDMEDFSASSNRSQSIRSSLPPSALAWVDEVLQDPDYALVKEARDSLTHSRVRRHLSLGGSGPTPRLEIESSRRRQPVRLLVETSVRVAERHVLALFAALPSL